MKEAIFWSDQHQNHFIICLSLRRPEGRPGCHYCLWQWPPPILLWWYQLTWSYHPPTFNLWYPIILQWLSLNHQWYKSCIIWYLTCRPLESLMLTLVLPGWPYQWGMSVVGQRLLVPSLGVSSNTPGRWRQCKVSPTLWVGVSCHEHFKIVFGVKGDNSRWLRGCLRGWWWWWFPQEMCYQRMHVQSSFGPHPE